MNIDEWLVLSKSDNSSDKLKCINGIPHLSDIDKMIPVLLKLTKDENELVGKHASAMLARYTVQREALILDIIIKSLSPKCLAMFLVKLGHSLTISARNTYEPKTFNIENPKALRGINEIMHRILSQALATFNNGERCPEDTFAEMLFEFATIYECTFELEHAVVFSVEQLRNTYERVSN